MQQNIQNVPCLLQSNREISPVKPPKGRGWFAAGKKATKSHERCEIEMHAFLIGMKISADPEDVAMTNCHVEWESHPQMGIFSYVIMLD
jgi:hypothetical protein